jgi:hypothetical protein
MVRRIVWSVHHGVPTKQPTTQRCTVIKKQLSMLHRGSEVIYSHHGDANQVDIVEGPDIGLDDERLLVGRERKDDSHAVLYALNNFVR